MLSHAESRGAIASSLFVYELSIHRMQSDLLELTNNHSVKCLLVKWSGAQNQGIRLTKNLIENST
jgi:hypothetical protein